MREKDKIENVETFASNKEKKKKRILFYTPKTLRAELDKMGESTNKKEVLIIAGALLAFAFVLMRIFALKPVFFIPICLCFAYTIPFIIVHSKKRKYEKKRFQETNSYLSHMGQSFRDTKSILTSLNETENKYRSGRMKSTLQTAIKIIRDSANIQNGEKEALAYIEEEYGCKKLHSFHEYIIKAERRGGDCNEELTLLEKIKNEWARAVENGYKTFCSNIYLMYLEIAVLLIICAFIQSRLPNEFAIMHMTFIQVTNVILICLFTLIFILFDGKTAKNLLMDAKEMSEEEARKGFETIEKLDIKNNLIKGLPYAAIFLVLFGVMFFLTKKTVILGIGVVLMLIVLNIYNISYFAFKSQIKSELALSFPEWIFDVILLVQKENVQVAIIKSIDNAPAVLKHELYGLKDKIVAAPSDPNSYLSFLERFEIDGVEDAMRTLYSVSQGSGSKESLSVIAENNMQSLANAEKRRIESKNAYSAAYIYLPIMPCVFALIAYGGALLVNIFQTVMQLLG